MSKELEALYSQIKERLANDDGKTHQTINLDISVSAMKEVLQALTPPTEQQLCEEIAKHLDFDKYHSECIFKNGNFYEYCSDGMLEDIVECHNGNLDFTIHFPISIVKRIALFYENEVKE